MFAAERKRATWTRRCEEKLPKALSQLSYQVKDSEKFGLAACAPVMKPQLFRQFIADELQLIWHDVVSDLMMVAGPVQE